MVPTNNSAGRLYAILSTLRAVLPNQGSAPVFRTWANVLGVPPDDVPAVFSSVVEIQELAAEVRRQVESAPGGNPALYLRGFGRIERLLSLTNLDSPSVGAASIVDDVSMTELAFCADYLERVASEKPIEEDELASFSSTVDALAQDLESGTIEPEVRDVMRTILEALRHAVALYRIRGAEAFRQALVTAFGELFLQRDVVTKAKDSPEMGRLSKLLERAGTLASRARPVLEMVKLGFDIKAALTGGPPPAG